MPDYLRAGFGVATTGGLLLFVTPASVMLWLLAGFAVLFLVFGLQTARRQMTAYELGASGLRVLSPLGAVIKWEELRSVELRYYSTRKDRSNGWMQLILHGGGRAIRIDSSVTGFAELAQAAAAAAHDRHLPLSAASRSNLASLGILQADPDQAVKP